MKQQKEDKLNEFNFKLVSFTYNYDEIIHNKNMLRIIFQS